MSAPELLPEAWEGTDRHPELTGETLATLSCENGEVRFYDRENPNAWIQGAAVDVGEQRSQTPR